MKISKKLQSEIYQEINHQVTQFLIHLDELDRTDQINHAAWQSIHQRACSLTPNIESVVIRTIESYRK
jgi:hypothetical protein